MLDVRIMRVFLYRDNAHVYVHARLSTREPRRIWAIEVHVSGFEWKRDMRERMNEQASVAWCAWATVRVFVLLLE